jgi:hypothetical protein
MTPFEQWSLAAYYLQLVLIGGGFWMVHKSGQRRDKQLDVMTRGIERLLERE